MGSPVILEVRKTSLAYIFPPYLIDVKGITFTTGRIRLISSSLITNTGRVLPCSEPTTGSRFAKNIFHLNSDITYSHPSMSVCSKSWFIAFISSRYIGSLTAVFNSSILSLKLRLPGLTSRITSISSFSAIC